MSESNRIPLAPYELRALGMRLLRTCWLPSLIVMLLALLPVLAGLAVLHFGPTSATAALEEFTTAAVEGLAIRQMNASSPAPGTQIAAILVEMLLTLLLTPVFTLGLYKALLGQLRGKGCTARCLLSGFKRWKTAIALDFLTGLRVLGYMILGGLAVLLLRFIPILGPLVGALGYMVLIYWATLRYLLGPAHLADDADHLCSATDCLDYSVADANNFGVTSLLNVVWPMYIPSILSSLLMELFSASPACTILAGLLTGVSTILQVACCAAVYAYLRQVNLTEDEAIPAGLARARALAAGEEYTEE